uniref:RING-type E3 ubiquitin transferase n=1 Tax=Caenorhabditis tropicalis TaxID=1561998 RepID=A0A1I7UNM6_9PELO
MCAYFIFFIAIFPIAELITYLINTYTGLNIEHAPNFLYYGFFIMTVGWSIVFGFRYYRKYKKRRAKAFEPLIEEDVMCTICYDFFVNPHTLRCQHSFCKKCIGQSLPITRRCPSCQQWVYFSDKNKVLKSKVLEWVKENGREEEYEEDVKMQSDIKPVKIGLRARLIPFILPLFDEPRRQGPQEIPLRPIRQEQNIRDYSPEPVIVHMVDEVDFLPSHAPRPLRTPLSVIMEVSEDIHGSTSSLNQLSAANSYSSIHTEIRSVHSV